MFKSLYLILILIIILSNCKSSTFTPQNISPGLEGEWLQTQSMTTNMTYTGSISDSHAESFVLNHDKSYLHRFYTNGIIREETPMEGLWSIDSNMSILTFTGFIVTNFITNTSGITQEVYQYVSAIILNYFISLTSNNSYNMNVTNKSKIQKYSVYNSQNTNLEIIRDIGMGGGETNNVFTKIR